MSARKRRRRQAVKPAAVQVQAAAKPLNIGKSSRPRLALPVVLADRLDAIEARITAVEQTVECPWACGRDACPWRCGGGQ